MLTGNIKRKKDGKNPANSLWFWGEGTKPNLENFEKKYGLKGGMISAVDLLKGIGKLAGMRVIEVEGATGNYDTNFSGKAKACLEALDGGLDLVYLHMEAPDECGHHGDVKNKIYSIEQIDFGRSYANIRLGSHIFFRQLHMYTNGLHIRIWNKLFKLLLVR